MDFEPTTLGGGWCKNCGEIIEHHSRYEKDGYVAWKCPIIIKQTEIKDK